MVPENEEIQELSEEYKENSESEPENRRKGVTMVNFPRKKTNDSGKNSFAGEVNQAPENRPHPTKARFLFFLF